MNRNDIREHIRSVVEHRTTGLDLRSSKNRNQLVGIIVEETMQLIEACGGKVEPAVLRGRIGQGVIVLLERHVPPGEYKLQLEKDPKE